MKRILSLVVLLVGLLAYGVNTYASASKPIDLQIKSAVFEKKTVNETENSLLVYIQNNGTERFYGNVTLKLFFWRGNEIFETRLIVEPENYTYFRVPVSSDEGLYQIYITSSSEAEKEYTDNNYFSYDSQQIGVVSHGMAAKNYRDTLFVLPGEYFFQSFQATSFNQQSLITGINFSARTYNMSDLQGYCFWAQPAETGEFKNGKYLYQNASKGNYKAYFQWMANTSDAALDYFWLGAFDGQAGMTVNSETQIYINASFVVKGSREIRNYSLMKVIKTIDRIRCDVNDDGFVNEADLEIMTDVVLNERHNPSGSFKNLYQERGLNYGAGIILFSRPDFVSNCLFNIWLHDKNDPAVKDLGIGEMMSEQGNSIVKVANTFSVSRSNVDVNASEPNAYDVTINAPGANVYNITARRGDGTLFQKTEKIDGLTVISIPTDSCLTVETVRLPEAVVTKVFETRADENLLSVFPTRFDEQVTVEGEEGMLSIFNANGQLISSLELNGGQSIATGSWSKGLYIFKIVTSDGSVQTVKVIK